MDKEIYNQFIEGLEIGEINLRASQTEANTPDLDYEECTTAIGFEVEDYQIFPGDETRFWVFTASSLTFELDNDEEAGFILVQHVINYRSPVPVNDEIFEIFSTGNVQFHVWPFVREYVQAATVRFGWPAFTLPTFVSSEGEKSDTEGTSEDE